MPWPWRTGFILLERLTALPEDEIRSRFGLLAECGYDGVELQLAKPFGSPLEKLEGWLKEAGLVVPSFLTGEAYADGLCLSSPDARTRAETVKRLIDYLDVAHRFSAVMVVGLLQGRASDEPDANRAIPRIEEGLAEVAAAAVARGVDMVIEPVNHLQVGFHNSVGEVRDLIARVGSPAIRPMVDTVHMNIEESSLTQPILDCGPTLRHVHLCESNGARFGSGGIDFADVFGALKRIDYRGFCSIKVYRNLDFAEAARTSIAHLRALPV